LGYLISERGIEGNPEKIQAIINMQPLKTIRHVQQLTGHLAALSRFISKFGEKALPFYRLLRETDKFTWTEEAQAAFDDLSLKNSPLHFFLASAIPPTHAPPPHLCRSSVQH
jgi:hypothetical protein